MSQIRDHPKLGHLTLIIISARLFLVTIMGTINWHPPELTAFEMLWISDNGAKVTSYTAACLLVRVFVLFLFFLDGTCKSSCVNVSGKTKD